MKDLKYAIKKKLIWIILNQPLSKNVLFKKSTTNFKTVTLNRTTSTSTGSFGGGKTEVYFDDNVHQDISSLAARTHAEQSSGNHAGRRRMMSQQDGEPPRSDLVTGVTQLEKAAQGGHGFQTVGLDIGVLGGRNNVDDEMRQQSGYGNSGSQHLSSSSRNVHYSSGGRTGSSGAHYSSNQGYNQNDYDYEEVDEYDDSEVEDHDDRQGSAYSSQSSFSHSYSSNSDTGNPELKLYRKTREVVNLGSENSLCQSAHCVNVRCIVGPLEKNTGALVALRMRLVAHTLHKVIGFF